MATVSFDDLLNDYGNLTQQDFVKKYEAFRFDSLRNVLIERFDANEGDLVKKPKPQRRTLAKRIYEALSTGPYANENIDQHDEDIWDFDFTNPASRIQGERMLQSYDLSRLQKILRDEFCLDPSGYESREAIIDKIVELVREFHQAVYQNDEDNDEDLRGTTVPNDEESDSDADSRAVAEKLKKSSGRTTSTWRFLLASSASHFTMAGIECM